MNKVMLITGANEGIGYNMLKSWLELGNIAVVLDICLDNTIKLKRQYESKLLAYICNVSNYNIVKSKVDEVMGILSEFNKSCPTIYERCE